MKNQIDLVDRMSRLMDAIESGGCDTEKAGAIIKAADVVVQVMKTEAAIYSASGGVMRPSFIALAHTPAPLPPEEAEQERERQRIAAEKAARQKRLERA